MQRLSFDLLIRRNAALTDWLAGRLSNLLSASNLKRDATVCQETQSLLERDEKKKRTSERLKGGGVMEV